MKTVTRDGRNIDPMLGLLAGEGATVAVTRPEAAQPIPAPVEPGPAELGPTYYELPLLHPSVWKLYIPIYIWAGGAAGAAAALGAAVQLAGGDRRLVRSCRWIAAGGTAFGAVLLIADLGRPSRALNMMRVFRPTSPMNVGTWILAAANAANAAAAVVPGVLGDLAGVMAGIAGVPLTGYTGVLLVNTAVPIWRGAARELPRFFVASAASAAGSLLELAGFAGRSGRTVRLFAAAGKAAEIATGMAIERAAGEVPRVARPLREGATGALWKAGKVLAALGLVCSVVSAFRPTRRWSSAAGVLGAAGALAAKVAITEAGKASARDPRATFEQQR